jgi:hypothetical protein
MNCKVYEKGRSRFNEGTVRHLLEDSRKVTKTVKIARMPRKSKQVSPEYQSTASPAYQAAR